MDETPIWVDMPSKTTVDQRVLKTVPIKSAGHEKQHIKADGSKMKRFVVIPGKKVKSEIAAIKGAIVKCSANGWMNDELTEDWVSHLWGSDVNKIHCLKKGQWTEEARMLLDESSGNYSKANAGR